MPLGETKIGLMAAASGDSNYFGDGSDGAVTTSGNLTYTVSNTNGTYQGDMVVKNYTNFTISAGHTVTVDHNCSGMLIYCTGNCVINGSLQMNQRGSSLDSGWPANNPIDGEDAIWMPMFTASAGSQSLTVTAPSFTNCGSAATTAVAEQPGISGNGSLFTIAGGSAGGGRSASNSSQTGGTGGGGTQPSGTHEYWVRTGGGGGGGAQHESVGGAHSSSGGTGSPISGGSGGGGAGAYHGSASAGGVNNHTGTGGQGAAHGGHNNGAGGGAGQPGGGGASAGNGSGNSGSSGNGGIIWLIVGGNLTFGANAVIEGKGSNGGSGGGYKSGGGGGSGGGAAHIIYAGTLTDAGCAYTFTGGNGGGGGGAGGPGGTGGHLITQVSA